MTNAIFGQMLTAMVTPFDKNGGIDVEAVTNLVEYLLANGSDGIVVCGTTGESPTLSHKEKLLLFSLVKNCVNGRGQVLAGSGSNDTAESITLTMEAADIGVDGVLLVTPPYNKPSQEGLFRHFCAIASHVRIPCMVYNVPSRTARNLEAATTIRLSREVPNIVAVKEASGDLMQCTEILAGAREGFALYSGEDGLTLPILALGGCGVVSVTSHLVGNEIKAMHSAFFAGHIKEAARINASMLPIVKACFQPTTSSPVPLKAALNMMGLPSGSLRLPLVEANEQERTIVKSALTEFGLLQ